MKTKKEIVTDWLPRYTGTAVEEFGEYILLVNFSFYVELFANWFGCEVWGKGLAMRSATHNNITIVNFGMGSPNAGSIIHLLSVVEPKAVLFLVKCGELKAHTNHVRDLILRIAAIRGEGTSDDYLP